MKAATETPFAQLAKALADLGARHGLSNLRWVGDGRVIAAITEGATYLDVARFETEAEVMLLAGVSVVLSESPNATSDQGGG